MVDIQKLAARGYEGAAGKLMAEKLSKVDSRFNEGIQLWLSDGIETDYEIEGIKLSELVSKFSLKYPAAILSLDWLLREPEKAKLSIKRGIR